MPGPWLSRPLPDRIDRSQRGVALSRSAFEIFVFLWENRNHPFSREMLKAQMD